MFRKILLSSAVLTMLCATPAAAQEQAIVLESDVMVVERSEAGTELVKAERVVPGDELELRTTYKNNSGQTVTDFVITSAVPSNVVADAQSVVDLDTSVDGGSAWGPLAQLTVQNSDGTDRPATLADITHVRWTIEELTASQTGVVSYRATVR